MDINWPHVRQVILNDRLNGYKPDKAILKRLSLAIPDIKVLGFGKYYEKHWYLIVESVMFFPYSISPTNSAIPVSSVFNSLARSGGPK